MGMGLMEIRLEFDRGQVERLRKDLRDIPGGSSRAVVAAINKTLPGMRTDAVREVTKVYIIKAGDVRSTLKIRKASKATLTGSVNSEGAAIPLIKFKTSPRKVTKRRPKQGVKVQVRRGGGGVIPNAFIVGGGRYPLNVYKRKDHRRYPILGQFGPAVPSMLKDEGAFDQIQDSADKRLEKNLDHEIYRILKGFGK